MELRVELTTDEGTDLNSISITAIEDNGDVLGYVEAYGLDEVEQVPILEDEIIDFGCCELAKELILSHDSTIYIKMIKSHRRGVGRALITKIEEIADEYNIGSICGDLPLEAGGPQYFDSIDKLEPWYMGLGYSVIRTHACFFKHIE